MIVESAQRENVEWFLYKIEPNSRNIIRQKELREKLLKRILSEFLDEIFLISDFYF